MTDIALVPGPDGITADVLVVNGDLLTDDGFDTAVCLSLLCDRVADPDDVLPIGSTNRGGCWFDAYLDPLPDGSPDYFGSKLWLRRRCLANTQTQLVIEKDIADALNWMVLDGAAAAVDVVSQYVTNTGLMNRITITQMLPGGQTALRRYDALWNTALGNLLITSAASGYAATTSAGNFSTDFSSDFA